MAQLVYWSLQQYDHVPQVRAGRKALCKQMTALMLSQWRMHRHICENFSPHKTADDSGGDCSGTKFYHVRGSRARAPAAVLPRGSASSRPRLQLRLTLRLTLGIELDSRLSSGGHSQA